MLIALPLAVLIVLLVALYRVGTGRRQALLREAALLATGFLAYFGVRSVTEGNVDVAEANAETLIGFQERLGIFIEPTLNDVAANTEWLLTVLNWVYIWGHWPLIAIVAAWLYMRHPSGYRLTRNAFLISGAIGLVFFALLPTAPPRLMDMGFMDTVSEHSYFYRLLQPPSVTNQYAAFPSLHFGWNLLIGIAIARYARLPVIRIAGALTPVAMLLATLFTANHYIIDVVVGGMVALIGLAAATWLARNGGRVRGASAEPPSHPVT